MNLLPFFRTYRSLSRILGSPMRRRRSPTSAAARRRPTQAASAAASTQSFFLVPSTGSLPAPRLSAPERDAAPNPSRRVRHCRRHGTATPLCPRTTSSSPESVVGRCVAKRQQQTPRRRGTRARRRRTTSPTNPTTPPPPPSPPPSTRYAPARFLFLSHLRSVARLESTLARFGPTCFSSCSIVRFNPSAIWVQRQRIARGELRQCVLRPCHQQVERLCSITLQFC
jgi:hypothetical protein